MGDFEINDLSFEEVENLNNEAQLMRCENITKKFEDRILKICDIYNKLREKFYNIQFDQNPEWEYKPNA